METTAIKKGGKYILNGTKTFITNGSICDFVCVAAYTDKIKGTRGGVSLFIVDKATSGVHSSKLHKFCAQSGEIDELTFEDCAIPEDGLIGEEGRGFPYIMQTLECGRIGHAARSLGLARAAYDAAAKHAKQRIQFGQSIARFQTISGDRIVWGLQISALYGLVPLIQPVSSTLRIQPFHFQVLKKYRSHFPE